MVQSSSTPQTPSSPPTPPDGGSPPPDDRGWCPPLLDGRRCGVRHGVVLDSLSILVIGIVHPSVIGFGVVSRVVVLAYLMRGVEWDASGCAAGRRVQPTDPGTAATPVPVRFPALGAPAYVAQDSAAAVLKATGGYLRMYDLAVCRIARACWRFAIWRPPSPQPSGVVTRTPD